MNNFFIWAAGISVGVVIFGGIAYHLTQITFLKYAIWFCAGIYFGVYFKVLFLDKTRR